MRKTLKISFFAAAAICLAALSVSKPALAAGTAAFSLSPASGSYTAGNTVSVDIYEDSGTDNVNTVEADLTYSAAILTYQSVVTGSHWDYSLATSGGGGSISLQRAHCESPGQNQPCTALSGRVLVATVKLTAAAAGQATISFAGGTTLYRTSDNGAETLTKTGAAYTISAPAAPPPVSGGGSGSTSGGSSSSAPKTTPKSTPSASSSPSTSSSTPPSSNPVSTPAGPAISNIQVKNLSNSTATISWQTSVPATSEVDYGTDTHYGFVAVDNTLTKDHSVVLDPSYLLADKTYHYLVKSVDASGKSIASQDVSFKTLASGGSDTTKSSNNLWAALAALLVLAAAVFVGISLLLRHLRGQLPVTPAAIGPSGGIHGGAVINPSAKHSPPAPIILNSPPKAAPKTTIITPTDGDSPKPAGPSDKTAK